MNNKVEIINKIGRVVLDGLMVMLLWAILILPISSFSLLKFKTNDSNVLSGQSVREQVIIDDTKTVRTPIHIISETSDNFYIYDARGSK
ncbi:hypothetical protein A2V49_00570 [candidate division WWE3 bacterium RBG_19FT_COMBO_34_6]|uniref:Uncharacterized protein n=1 Tax=candidate division WWE3 bacterium RBG_19FT_COMBO_34_6 TaxID=1802612 RepID=A0A1F4UNI3_UNCKA|nr:MAG: hypothetical protein A2V49_00570 [candidate division WWE3 bacterium RBG_19FT_COMBO_34_6]